MTSCLVLQNKRQHSGQQNRNSNVNNAGNAPVVSPNANRNNSFRPRGGAFNARGNFRGKQYTQHLPVLGNYINKVNRGSWANKKTTAIQRAKYYNNLTLDQNRGKKPVLHSYSQSIDMSSPMLLLDLLLSLWILIFEEFRLQLQQL